MPDEYAAWSWRSYHSSCDDLVITGPKRPSRGGGKEPDWGLGYGGYLGAKDKRTFSVEMKGDYERVEYHDGNRIVGAATSAPWEVKQVTLDPGLHVLFAVGVKKDGSRSASRPALVIVK